MNNNFKKITAAAIAIAALQLTAFADSAPHAFTDIGKGAQGEALISAVNNGLFFGYDDNTIRPDQNITRAEFVSVAVRALGVKENGDISAISDVSADAWYASSVAKAVSAGLADADKQFRPTDAITRAEADEIYSNIIGEAFAENNPSENITRGGAAELLDKLAKQYIDKESTLELKTDGSVIIRNPGVIANSEINGNLILADGASKGEVVLDNVSISGDLIVRSSGRVDFSGKADTVRVISDNSDVYAISDVAEIKNSEIKGNNSNIITKSYADYQTVAWEENKIDLPTGVTLAYTVSGPEDGTPVVLIHGLTDGRVSWSQVAPALAEKGYRVYVPEYRGNGKTDKPYGDEDAYSVENLTKEIAAFLDALGIEKANIVGHSLGSIIAQELNISYKDKIASITLIGTGARLDAENETIDWLVNGDGEEFNGIYGYEDTQKLPEDFIEAWGYSTNPDADFQAANLEHLRQTPYYVWKALVSNLLKFDNSERLKDITGRVQIIWGSEDVLFPKEEQDFLREGLVNSEVIFHEIEGADHNTHWGSEETVNTVADYIDSFIK